MMSRHNIVTREVFIASLEGVGAAPAGRPRAGDFLVQPEESLHLFLVRSAPPASGSARDRGFRESAAALAE